MSDEIVLDYTINDPSAVTCPYCHGVMNLEDELAGVLEVSTQCHLCYRDIILKITTEVLAWKPEALQ
jgi:hypothetical protein